MGYLSRLEPAEFDDRTRRLLVSRRRHTWLRGIDRRQLWANTRSSPS